MLQKIRNRLISSQTGSRTTATSKMECYVIVVNGWKSLTIITKHSILDVAAALDPPLPASFDGTALELYLSYILVKSFNISVSVKKTILWVL